MAGNKMSFQVRTEGTAMSSEPINFPDLIATATFEGLEARLFSTHSRNKKFTRLLEKFMREAAAGTTPHTHVVLDSCAEAGFDRSVSQLIMQAVRQVVESAPSQRTKRLIT